MKMLIRSRLVTSRERYKRQDSQETLVNLIRHLLFNPIDAINGHTYVKKSLAEGALYIQAIGGKAERFDWFYSRSQLQIFWAFLFSWINAIIEVT